SGRLWLPLLLVGTLDVTANATYAFASQEGPIAIVAVIASMFPITTVLLAHRFLGERIARSQKIGVAVALLGVVVLAST
ncbi:MAG: EamA family transporter, partial [Solirubrobacterales bacterium]